MRRASLLTVAIAALATFVAACGGDAEEQVDDTVAVLMPVRGSTLLGESGVAVLARAGAGQEVAVSENGLARLVLDSGPRLLLGAGAAAKVLDAAAVELTAGQAFVQVGAGDRVSLTTSRGELRLTDAGVSVRVQGEDVVAYVVRGELAFTTDSDRGIARAGQELTLSAAEPAIRAATLWDDWTFGLARPGPVSEDGARGVGMLEARVPDEVGKARWPLVVRRLDVRVRVVSDLAITEVDQIFFNPASETVEGLYRIRVPEEAVLQRFAVDRNGRLVDGYVREKAQARQAYEAQVYRGSTLDPALLEWDAPGAYRARIYPIPAGATRRIVTRYAEWLGRPEQGAPRVYRYPMGGGVRAPQVQELFLTADVSQAGTQRVRAGMGAEIEDGIVKLRRSDYRPRSDFWLELLDETPSEALRAFRAPHQPPQRAPGSRAITNEADERDYWYLPVVLPESVLGDMAAPEGIDLVVIADVSAATDRSHLELGRSMVESLVSHLDANDRVAVVTGDLTIRSVLEEDPELGPATAERLDQLLDGLARVPAGGATDLGAAIAAAADLLDASRPGAVVYVGDGAPTVGELRAEGLLEHMGRLPSPVRLYALAVGADADLELLDALTRGGGLAMRVEERAGAADAAMRVLAHVARPLAQRVTVDVGTGIENVFPRRPVDVVVGDVLPVAGRIRDDVPTEVTVRGTLWGREFEQRLSVQTAETTEATDLRLRWAGERLRQLLLEGASREEVAELGTRYGLITPFTSYYVPSAQELSQLGPQGDVLVDQPLLQMAASTRTERASAIEHGLAQVGEAVLLGPLALTGCAFGGSSDEQAAAPESNVRLGSGQPVATSDNTVSVATEVEVSEEEAPMEALAEPEPETAAQAVAANEDGRLQGMLADQEGRMAQPAPPAVTVPSGSATASKRAPSRRARRRPDAPSDDASRDPASGVEVQMDFDTDELSDIVGGTATGESYGLGGLGLRGSGRGGGGGGEGTIGLGNLGAIGHGGGGGTGSGYGRGSGDSGAREANRTARVRTGQAEVMGSLSKEVIRRVIRRHINEVRHCYQVGLQSKPQLAGRVETSFVISSSGTVQTSSVRSSTLADPTVEQCVVQAVRRWSFPAPEGGGVVVVNYPFLFAGGGGGSAVRASIVSIHHRPRRCSDAAGMLIDDRRALWRERLQSAQGVAGWLEVYRNAIRECEAPTWRDRRALLTLILGKAGNIQNMVRVYHQLSSGSARGWLRAAILRRVRTPEDLRVVRGSFGLRQGVDWELVQGLVERAQNPRARVRVLRQLVQQYPSSFDLKLRLLEELERADRGAEARRLADRMRADPMADAGVRTAIGEMYLRMDDTDEARRVFSEIVEFAPLDELARRRLGDLYRAHGWFEDAYRQYLTLSEIRPDDPTVFLLLAQAAAGAGRVDEALRLEQRLAETAEPGGAEGVARTAILWSSVRFAKLRKEARADGDDDRVRALLGRMRSSGVLREAGDMRVSLTWSHPDAQLTLWGGHPGLGLTRPMDIAPDFGIEAFDVEEAETGTYRIEVRRTALGRNREHLTSIDAELVVVWNEGTPDEQIEVVPLRFEGEELAMGWTIEGRTLAQAEPTAQVTGRSRR